MATGINLESQSKITKANRIAKNALEVKVAEQKKLLAVGFGRLASEEVDFECKCHEHVRMMQLNHYVAKRIQEAWM